MPDKIATNGKHRCSCLPFGPEWHTFGLSARQRQVSWNVVFIWGVALMVSWLMALGVLKLFEILRDMLR